MSKNKLIYILLLIVCLSSFIWLIDFPLHLKGPINLVLGLMGIVIIKKQWINHRFKYRGLFLGLISVSTVLSLLFVSLLVINSLLNYIAQKNLYKNLIEVDLPKNIKVLKSDDSHGGFLGEGTFYTCIQLNESQMKNFISTASKNSNWKRMPLPDELNKYMFGYMKKNPDGDYYVQGKAIGIIPLDIKHGIYYFRDKYAENYPEYKNTSILDETRYSDNFIFGILDSDTRKLYIIALDT